MLFIAILATWAIASPAAAVCSSQKCPSLENNKFYTIHLVPHSHMDLGWLKTVDQYFFGTRSDITTDAVQYVYDSVLDQLQVDPNRRFNFVETGFFELWWNHRDNATRQAFKNLVLNGQIEFVSGGYVMNDEAITHYMSIIDQMTLGLKILKENFGVCGVSQIGWQIDPFGHSREYASLLAQMGYKGLIVNRVDTTEFAIRNSEKRMEFNWQGSSSLPNANLTGIILPSHYSPPSGLCFDEKCSDEVVVEDNLSDEFNAPRRAQDLIKWVSDRSNGYATNNYIVTMGDDFNYMDANKWMSNIDALIRTVNAGQFKINNLPVRAVYSTPSCYLQSIQNQKFTTKSDDFLPLSTGPHTYWTGFFTSRTAFKYIERFSNNVFQAVKQLTAMAGISSDAIIELARSLAIAQHHDAMPGTEKQHVNDDYVRRLSIGLDQAEQVAITALNKLAGGNGTNLTICRGLNISQCDEIVDTMYSNDGVTVIAYNPSTQKVHKYLRIPFTNKTSSFVVAVYSQGKQSIDFDIVPIASGVARLAERSSKALYEIVVPVDIDPLGFTTFTIHALATGPTETPKYVERKITKETTIERDGTVLHFDPFKGLTQITMNNITTNVSQGYFYYKSFAKDQDGYPKSGAYIMEVDGDLQPIPLTEQRYYEGQTITEIHTKYSDWVSDTLRLTAGGQIEYDWVVGPIPIDDNNGKEVVWRIQTDIASNDAFTTDCNSRENLQRIRNARPSWNETIVDPVSGNYYPITGYISIKDDKRQFDVFTERSHGGSSLASGAIEIMLHRRLLVVEGIGEALNETGFDGKGLQIRGTHAISLNAPNGLHRVNVLQRALKPFVAFSSSRIPPKQNLINAAVLPSNVQVLSLEQLSNGVVLIRLENIFEQKDNPRTAVIDLSQLFFNRISNVQETLLAANVPATNPSPNPSQIRLTPMQIRTFIVTLTP